MSSETWREAIARENERLGIRLKTPPPVAPPKKFTGHVDMIESTRDLAGQFRQRHVVNEMNGLEKKYAAYLETRRLTGEIVGWKFEAMKLKLARATFYNPDFLVVTLEYRIELHETKGFARDDWRVKHKIAIEMFPEFRFVIVCWNKNTKGWNFKTMGAGSDGLY